MAMAISKVFIFCLFLSALLLQLVQSEQPQKKPNQTLGNSVNDDVINSPPPSVKIDCGGACAARCSKSKRPNLCQRACGSCCSRCNCVPPGTFGNYDACLCYAKLTTRGNRRKCP